MYFSSKAAITVFKDISILAFLSFYGGLGLRVEECSDKNDGICAINIA